MLRWRLLSAAILLPALVGLLALDHFFNFGLPGIWLLPLVSGVMLSAAAEMLVLAGVPRPRDAWPALVAALLIATASAAPRIRELAIEAAWRWLHAWGKPPDLGELGWPLAAMLGGIVLVAAVEIARYGRLPGGGQRMIASIFTLGYLGVTFALLCGLRFLGTSELGMTALVSAVAVVKLSDVGQYAAGRLFGRHKLAARVSPGKTIEGAAGGLVFACLTSWLYFTWIAPLLAGGALPPVAWWRAILFGIVVMPAGVAGDLAISLIKREAGKKDTARLLPGMGGVLDVLDSLLFAGPAAWLCWKLGLLGVVV